MEKINLTGKWIVQRWEIRTLADRWENAIKNPCNENDVWIFGSVDDTDDQLEGTLICVFGDSDVSFSTFSFNKKDASLYVEDESGEGHDERYRVVKQSLETIILYSLEGVSDESEGYRQRVILKKFAYVSE